MEPAKEQRLLEGWWPWNQLKNPTSKPCIQVVDMNGWLQIQEFDCPVKLLWYYCYIHVYFFLQQKTYIYNIILYNNYIYFFFPKMRDLVSGWLRFGPWSCFFSSRSFAAQRLSERHILPQEVYVTRYLYIWTSTTDFEQHCWLNRNSNLPQFRNGRSDGRCIQYTVYRTSSLWQQHPINKPPVPGKLSDGKREPWDI